MSCHRHSWDLVLLWLWCRPAAVALIRPLAWELLYAKGAALKRQKGQKKKKESSEIETELKLTFMVTKQVFKGREKNVSHPAL